MITVNIFHTFRIDATECEDFEHFCAEEGGSLPGCYFDNNNPAYDPIKVMRRIWDLRTLDFRVLREMSDRTIVEFCRRYGIPERTFNSWVADGKDSRKPSAYIFDLIATDIINMLEAEEDVNYGGLC